MPKRECQASYAWMPKSSYDCEEEMIPQRKHKPEEDRMPRWCYEENMPGRYYPPEADMMPKRYYPPEEEETPPRLYESEDEMMADKYDETEEEMIPDEEDLMPERYCSDDKKTDFCHWVEEAIADEIKAVSMYAAMANMVDDSLLRALILNIAGDEYGHAKFWLAVLALSDC